MNNIWMRHATQNQPEKVDKLLHFCPDFSEFWFYTIQFLANKEQTKKPKGKHAGGPFFEKKKIAQNGLSHQSLKRQTFLAAAANTLCTWKAVY